MSCGMRCAVWEDPTGGMCEHCHDVMVAKVTGRGGVPIGLLEVEDPTLSRHRLTDCGKVDSFTLRLPFNPSKISGTHLLEAESNLVP
jgi:hypothetical protein